jgi:hypothetical protein
VLAKQLAEAVEAKSSTSAALDELQKQNLKLRAKLKQMLAKEKQQQQQPLHADVHLEHVQPLMSSAGSPSLLLMEAAADRSG